LEMPLASREGPVPPSGWAAIGMAAVQCDEEWSAGLTWCITFDTLASRGQMATRNPRVITVLDRSLYEHVKRAAKSEGVSISAKVRDMLREAAELDENRFWARAGEQRVRSFKKKNALSDREVWG